MNQATKSQLYALYLATGKCLELRNMELSKEDASILIRKSKNGENIIGILRDYGATEKEQKRSTKQVVVQISDGLVKVVEVPKGVEVIIKDYDVDVNTLSEETDDLKQDDSGYYFESIYQHVPESEAT